MLDIKDKVAIITGATGGIGGAIVENFASAGAKLMITGTNTSKLAEISKKYNNVEFMAVDLNDHEATESIITKTEEIFGSVDFLVCNAGITKDNLSIRMKTEDFEQVLDVNLVSSFILNKAAIKSMMKRKFGRIVNISSIVGSMGNMGQANYAAAKAGMVGMSKSLAQEVATRNININVVAPGFIATPMTDVLKDEHKQQMLAKIPQGKFGTPMDVANVVRFLVSPEASYLTGQTIHVNGGMLMV